MVIFGVMLAFLREWVGFQFPRKLTLGSISVSGELPGQGQTVTLKTLNYAFSFAHQ